MGFRTGVLYLIFLAVYCIVGAPSPAEPALDSL